MGKQGPTKILLTGSPGCGKTTVIIKLAQCLQGQRMAGFITEEILKDERRCGFMARTLRGDAALLASLDHNSWVSVGKYGVDVRSFEELVIPELTQDPTKIDLFLVDEIGKMECFCPEFVKAMNQLLDSPVSLVATVSQNGKGLIREVKERDDVELITVTPKNRDTLPEQIQARFV